MTDETRRHIFEPFFTTRDRAKHAGLGLSVVYGILTSHKGFIDVESTPGRGTTVSLFFPLESRRIYAAVGSQGENLELPGGHETILVVEDEEMLRALVKEVLSRAGYVVLEAADGEEGVQVFNEQHEHIDLVLLDLGLPKIAGDAVFQEMKLINPLVPVVFSSGYVRKEKANELLALGARGVVHKPYTVTSVLTTIRSVLDSKSVKN
jgi:CheY-like chemotaxis protein